MSRPLRRCPVAVLDFESTGVDATSCWPVSVAVLHCDLGLPGHELVLDTLINPGVPIPADATAIHGIRDQDVARAPDLDTAAAAIAEAIGDRLLMAYNLPYDWQILDRCLRGAGLNDGPAFGGLDPLVWAKAADKYKKGKKLVDVASRRGISTDDAHDASADVIMTAKVAPLLLRDVRQQELIPLDALDAVDTFLAWQNRVALEQELDFRAWCARQGRQEPRLTWHELLGVAAPAL